MVRKMLSATIISLASLLSIPLSSSETYSQSQPSSNPYEELTPANIALRNFPKQVPGAAEIKRYETPRARYSLVHILQKHPTIIDSQSSSEILDVQESIHEILTSLHAQGLAKIIYAEGIYAKRREELYVLRRTVKDDPDSGLGRDAVEAVDKLFFQGALDISEAERQETYFAGISALRKRQDILHQVAEESKSPNMNSEKVRALLRAARSPELTTKILDDREDILLQILSTTQEPIAFTVYGGAHAFGGKESCGEDYSLKRRVSLRDNIADWNRRHSDKKFSLIEIIPQGF